MKLFHIFLLCLATLFVNAQENFNLELIGQASYPENGNDIWGYAHTDGTEYAIVGTRLNTRIYDLSDPTQPRQIIAIPGDETTWRDMKSFGEYVYVTADNASDGLLVIDMSQVAENDSLRFQFLNPEVTTVNGPQILESCHNIFIDENGFAYLAGCSVANKAIIFDLNVDPWNPPIVGVHGVTGADYAHDLMVMNDIMYSSEINVGRLAIFDVTDKANIVELGSTQTSFNFTHNAWVSTDQNFVFTTDERGNAYVDAYDVSDPTNIVRLDVFQPAETAGNGVIPHNTHFIDGFVATSWYTDGVVITDVSRPDNMIKTGSFDTFLGPDGGFNGCWGVFPYLPSGLLLANDIQTGLYVFNPTYQRACYLEGNITSANDGSNINDATVEILDTPTGTTSNVAGDYKTGLAQADTYSVRFSHPEYEDLIVDGVILENGELTILDVQLIQLETAIITGRVIDSATGLGIPNSQVVFSGRGKEITGITDIDGNFIVDAFVEDYEVIVGAWSYLHLVQPIFNIANDEAIFMLDFGYMDDFVLDLGWQVESTASTGTWERAIPNGTGFQGQMSAIGQDIAGDIGEQAYITGNGTGGAGSDDIDDGSTTLTSPPMFLDLLDDALIEFTAYFFNAGGQGQPLNDQLSVQLTDGSSTVILTEFVSDSIASASTGDWTDVLRFRVADTGLDITQPITISYIASDDDPGHLVEAGVDVFKVVEASTVATEEISDLDFIKVYPNPADEMLNISSTEVNIDNIHMYNSLGQLVLSKSYSPKLNVSGLESGAYILVLDLETGVSRSTRVIIK